MAKTARDPTAEELAKMHALAEQAMRDGAWGMATGLIYVPATYSKTDEIAGIAQIVGRHGGIYASHIRDEGLQLLTSIEEALEIGKRGELPVHISHFKASGKSVWGSLHLAVELIEKARAEGRSVTADQYPYTASSTSLEATLLPSGAEKGGVRKSSGDWPTLRLARRFAKKSCGRFRTKPYSNRRLRSEATLGRQKPRRHRRRRESETRPASRWRSKPTAEPESSSST